MLGSAALALDYIDAAPLGLPPWVAPAAGWSVSAARRNMSAHTPNLSLRASRPSFSSFDLRASSSNVQFRCPTLFGLRSSVPGPPPSDPHAPCSTLHAPCSLLPALDACTACRPQPSRLFAGACTQSRNGSAWRPPPTSRPPCHPQSKPFTNSLHTAPGQQLRLSRHEPG
jgi:hypothetical protein